MIRTQASYSQSLSSYLVLGVVCSYTVYLKNLALSLIWGEKEKFDFGVLYSLLAHQTLPLSS